MLSCPVFVGICVYSLVVQARLVLLGTYAMHVGRTDCPWQQPRPRSWKQEDAGAALQSQGMAIPRKAPGPSGRGDSSTSPLPALSQAQCMEQKGAGGNLIYVRGRRHWPCRATLWPVASGLVKTIQRSPVGCTASPCRGLNQSLIWLAKPCPLRDVKPCTQIWTCLTSQPSDNHSHPTTECLPSSGAHFSSQEGFRHCTGGGSD